MSSGFRPPHPATNPDRLRALDAYNVLGHASEPAFDGFVLLARTICAAPAALLSFVADDHQRFVARSGVIPAQTPLGHSVCVHALDRVGVYVVPDLQADLLTRNNPVVAGSPGWRFYAGAPLRTATGHTLGTLCVLDTKPRAEGLSAEQTEALQVMAGQVMAQLELRRLLLAREAELNALRA